MRRELGWDVSAAGRAVGGLIVVGWRRDTVFYTHLLGYNLIRGVMATAAFEADRSPWAIRFKGTLQTLKEFLPILLTSVRSELWCEAFLTAVATHVVGNRPDRFEPRLRKRRPKPYKHLREPRRNYKP